MDNYGCLYRIFMGGRIMTHDIDKFNSAIRLF